MYEVEIVGSSLITKMAQSKKWIEEFKHVVLPEIGKEIQRCIQVKLNAGVYKNGDGSNMARACLVEVNKNELEVIIYNDDRIAKYTKYVEEGVHAHKMTYLQGKIIPFVMINGKFTFAGRNSKFYGDRDKKFVKVTANSIARGKWFNPGYPGKFYYRDGLKEAIVNIQKRLKIFTFRISTGEVFR
jgi:hypothetical protein